MAATGIPLAAKLRESPMGRVRRRDRACHDPPPLTNSHGEVAGIFARGIMRLRDNARDSSRASTGSLRLMPDAGEVDCHAQVPPAGASAAHEPAAGRAFPPP